eukprot:984791-Pelagomonas_calceolata.AAC.4
MGEAGLPHSWLHSSTRSDVRCVTRKKTQSQLIPATIKANLRQFILPRSTLLFWWHEEPSRAIKCLSAEYQQEFTKPVSAEQQAQDNSLLRHTYEPWKHLKGRMNMEAPGKKDIESINETLRMHEWKVQA